MTSQDRDALFDEVEALLGQERWPEALALLEGLPEDDPLRWLHAVEVWLGMGMPERARGMLERGTALAGVTDPFVGLLTARMHLLRFEVADARAALERVPKKARDADLEVELALVADLEGRFADADEHLARARKAEPELFAGPTRLSPEAFEAAVDAAAAELPPDIRAELEKLPVVIDPMPSAELLGGGESGLGPDVLGLYTGNELFDSASSGFGEMPPTIYLFQRNLERLAKDEDELRSEIRTTLFHELGHALGFDEDGVDDLGLR